MDREFTTYASEVVPSLGTGEKCRFALKIPQVPEAFRLSDTDEGKAEAYRRSLYVRELYGRYYPPTLTDLRRAKAFQIAIWEIVHEASWAADKPAPLDLDKGVFRAARDQADPESVQLARDYLKSLVGNDNVFFENPDLAGRELVWMKGLEGPRALRRSVEAPYAFRTRSIVGPAIRAFGQEREVLAAETSIPPSQFALQYVKGGGANTLNGMQNPLLANGGALGGGTGGGSGGSGYGGGAGGSGAFVGGTGGGPFSTSTPPTTTPPETIPPTVPPVNAPPTEPPVGTNTPVPAPAGILLAAIAIGALVGRRAMVQRTAKV
jgi:hypothetical protein